LASSEKGAQEEGRTIVFVDESGFYLLPALARTWAPKGQTPQLRLPLTRDHLSVIGALTTEGRLLTWTHEDSIKGSQVVEFLKHLLRQIKGKLLVVWDGATIHRCKAVKQFLSEGAAKRLLLMSLPGYAPELNPAEGVWQWLKRVALANVCCDDLDEVRYELRLAFAKLRYRPHVLHGCLKRVGYL
jgi:transposase